MLGNTTTTSGGVAGTLAGTIASDGAMAITAGGAGTTATGQVVLSLEIE
jgi:stage V sporulation protein SpoVS